MESITLQGLITQVEQFLAQLKRMQAPAADAEPNPFIEWKRLDGNLVDYRVWRNNGLELSAHQIEQAKAAGFAWIERDPTEGHPPHTGTDLNQRGVHGNTHPNGEPVQYTFSLDAPGRVELSAFGIESFQPGAWKSHLEGPSGVIDDTAWPGTQGGIKFGPAELPAGSYVWTVTASDIHRPGPLRVGTNRN